MARPGTFCTVLSSMCSGYWHEALIVIHIPTTSIKVASTHTRLITFARPLQKSRVHLPRPNGPAPRLTFSALKTIRGSPLRPSELVASHIAMVCMSPSSLEAILVQD
ncbi:hypothetical protein E4U53_003664 [Claviceps sorghi]|nr:hypothetical protein E4U53_003664 [Claviceps sorghi]